MAALIKLLGGPEVFIRRLDYLHTSGLVDIGNEPVFLTVFLYHYAGRPALSSLRAHNYISSSFNASTNGLPGNDDSGAMGAFQAFIMMGLFPNPGQNVYFITVPFFKAVSIRNDITGKTATVRVLNFNPDLKNAYIQSAKLNGQPYTKSWISHELLTEGWTLELILGDKESDWGTSMKDFPPSISAG